MNEEEGLWLVWHIDRPWFDCRTDKEGGSVVAFGWRRGKSVAAFGWRDRKVGDGGGGSVVTSG